MVGHGGSSAGSYLADPTSPIPSHYASIVVISTVRVKIITMVHCCASDVKVAEKDQVFQSIHSLLMVLYERDCRRSFSQPNHWLIR